MTHKKEIIRWSNTPDDTLVWVKTERGWELNSMPLWEPNRQYIIDDKYAKLRKAQVDGATIQMRFKTEAIWKDWGWKDWGCADWSLPPEAYRVKPKVAVNKWQFILQHPEGKYEMTPEHYGSFEEAEASRLSSLYKVIEVYYPSKKEFYE